MLEYLIQLPCDYLGQNVLGFLDLIDIIQFENAVTSHKSQKLLKAILPYCPSMVLSDSFNQLKFKQEALKWFIKRRICIKFVKIDLEILCEVNFEHCIIESIELCSKKYATLNHVLSLHNQYIREKVICVEIKSDQDPAVMEVLFLTLSSVRSLDIHTVNLFQWVENIKKLGPGLRELSLRGVAPQLTLCTITEHCPYLEKLNLCIVSNVSQSSSIVLSIANNCPHIRSLEINLNYSPSAKADSDLTALAEKCPQLEELSLTCRLLTDQSVIALAQHCSRLKKLKLDGCKLTANSLMALSERGLPLEELVIPSISISSAEIAAQCAYALSRIRELSINCFSKPKLSLFCGISFMTGIHELRLDSPEDHLLLPHLLLQGQCYADLVSLVIESMSSICSQQLTKLVSRCPRLEIFYSIHVNYMSEELLVELTRSCPHLQNVTLNCRYVTEKSVMTIVTHCRQLRVLKLSSIIITEETLNQIIMHCRHLTKLNVSVNVML